MSPMIRPALPGDSAALVALMQDHACYEGSAWVPASQEELLAAGRDLPVILRVVEHQEKVVGYMSLVQQFATWNMAWYLYLDCLYLSPACRGLGLGKALMAEAQAVARSLGLRELQWQTPEDNLSAIGFYQNLGAVAKCKQRFSWRA